MGEMKNACKILVGEPEVERLLGAPAVDSRIILK
jgi:hypothetical protein